MHEWYYLLCYQFNTAHTTEVEKKKSYQHHQSSSQCQLQICQQHVLQGTKPAPELQFPKISEDTSMHSCSARYAQNEPPYQGWSSHHWQCPALKYSKLTRIGKNSYSGFTMAFLNKRGENCKLICTWSIQSWGSLRPIKIKIYSHHETWHQTFDHTSSSHYGKVNAQNFVTRLCLYLKLLAYWCIISSFL